MFLLSKKQYINSGIFYLVCCKVLGNYETFDTGGGELRTNVKYKKVNQPAFTDVDNNDTKHVRRCWDPENRPEDTSCESEETTTVTRRPRTTTPQIILPHGPFFNFVVNICRVLLKNFSFDRIPPYFNVLGKSLKGLGPRYLMKMKINQISNTLRRLSVFKGRKLRNLVKEFLRIVMAGKPKRNDFFMAMNAIYTIQDDVKMDEYIYNLTKFGEKETRHIGDKTRNVFTVIVFYRYYKQSEEVQDDIKSKFNEAIIEYVKAKSN